MTIFISYRHEYYDFAHKLDERLQQWGYQSWLDKDRLVPGLQWRKQIHQALNEAEAVVGVVTPKALEESREVFVEIEYAFRRKPPCALVLLTFGNSHEFDYNLQSLQYIDFVEMEEELAFEQLHRALETLTKAQAASATPATPLPAPLAEAPVVSSPPPPPTIRPARMTLTMPEHAPIEATPSSDQKSRFNMIDRVQRFWIEGVLHNALKETDVIDLGLGRVSGAELRHVKYGDYVLPSSANIMEVFEEMYRELLILGAPGSGKTILLLQLAEQLLQNARQDPTLKIPVVLNLSTWTSNHGKFEDWLVSELHRAYQVSRKLARRWVENRDLLLLLDGLDEIRREHRESCVEAVNHFRHENRSVDIVVCSRIADYDELTTHFDFRGGILLHPLTDEQIFSNVQGDKLAGLRETLQTEQHMMEMARTPFMLSIMRVAYEGLGAQHLADFTGEKQRRDHLFDLYIERRYRQHPLNDLTLMRTQSYLAWLAHQMTTEAQRIFHIEGLQPTQLPDKAQQARFSFAVRLITALAISVPAGLAAGYAFWVIDGATLGLLSGIGLAIAWFVLAWIIATSGHRVSYGEIMTVAAAFGLAWGAIGVMTAGPIIGVLIGFAAAIGDFFALRMARTRLKEFRAVASPERVVLIGKMHWSWKWAGFGILFWLVTAFTIGLFWFLCIYGATEDFGKALAYGLGGYLSFVFSFGLGFGIISADLETKFFPNMGIWRSARYAIITTTFFGLMAMLGFGAGVGAAEGTTAGVVAGFLMGLAFGVTNGGAVWRLCGFAASHLAADFDARWLYST